MDWLYRIYHIQAEEISHAFNEEGFLSNADPKMAIAREFLDRPVDPNTATLPELLRVPESFCYYLSMHEDCNERILARGKDLQPEEVKTSTEPEVARIKKMVYAVMGELHRMKAFVRLLPRWERLYSVVL